MSIESYTAWESLGPLTVPTPWAMSEMGVPVAGVTIPFVAAASFEDLTITAQVVAAMRVRAFADATYRQEGDDDEQ